jgi:hypothetical protein
MVHVPVALLCEVFGDRIISSNIWPLRSPKLIAPDFFLWGALKNAAYKDNLHSLDDLKEAITKFTASNPCNELV